MNSFSKLPSLFIAILFLWGCQSNSTDQASPEITVAQWLHFSGNPSGSGKKIVLVSGDEEYRSEEALPQLAKILSQRHGFECTVLFAQDPAFPGIVDPNFTKNIPGLEALQEADLMILFTRFRDLPDEQMEFFENYLLAGKPLIGIRTATHAFNIKDSTSKWAHWDNFNNDPGDVWDGGFGRLVLGERWYTHHGHHKHQSTQGILALGSENHPVLQGLANQSIWGPTDVYGVRLPLPDDAMPLVLGQVMDGEGPFTESDAYFGLRETDSAIATVNPATETPYNPNEPMMPIAWLKSYELPQGNVGRSFTSTIGSSTDMANAGVRRLVVNACYYLMDLEVPGQSQVDLVGQYSPSAYSFQEDAYWDQKNLKIADLQEE